MAAKKKATPPDEGTLLEELERSLSEEMRKVKNDPDATLTDRTKIYDRVLKLCQIKLKIDDADESSGFDDD